MEISNEIIWLIAGIILIMIEFTVLPGVGMLFAGVAALLVGVAAENMGANLTYQWVIFLGATIILSALLYKPLRDFQTHKGLKYNDMIGHSAIVVGVLTPGTEGKVRWSGTVMKAQLQSANILSEGQAVTIFAVEGNILLVNEA